MDMQNVAKLEIPEGEVRSIHDKDGNLIWGKVSYGVKYKGDTVQNGTPTPSSPVAVQTVTGVQTITINGANYTVDLGSTELCGIGDDGAGGYLYQDYIYKDGADWKIHKAINKTILNGSESWSTTGSGIPYTTAISDYASSDNIPLSDYFIGYTNQTVATSLPADHIGFSSTTTVRLWFNYPNKFASTSDLRTWLGTHNTTIYYALATPTDTAITNAALIAQLEAVEQWLTRYGYNATVTGNLPIIVDRTAL